MHPRVSGVHQQMRCGGRRLGYKHMSALQLRLRLRIGSQPMVVQHALLCILYMGQVRRLPGSAKYRSEWLLVLR
jgi:hypothetical protein